LPPISAIAPHRALHEPASIETTRNSGISLERAREKYLTSAFPLSGNKAELLEMGRGRVTDNLALALAGNYAIL
jgi:hypothetical protein